MYQHFVQDLAYTAGVPSFPRFDYAKALMVSEHQRVDQYIKSSALSVNNSHMFVRLLSTLDTLYEPDVEKFILSVYRELDGIERMFGLASATNTRIMTYKGLLYSNEVHDVFLSVTEYFDYTSTPPASLVCCKAISHPISTVNLAAPDGKFRSRNGYAEDLSVTTIDVGKMAYVYWHWLGAKVESKGSDRLDYFAKFVYKYWLADMIKSVADIAFFNRVNNSLFGKPNDTFYPTYPIPINDFNSRFDEAISYYLTQFSKNTIIYDKVGSALPSIYSPNVATSLALPDININRNNAWIILVSRIDLYLLIFSLAEHQANNSDLVDITNKLRFIVRSIMVDNALNVRVPYQISTKISRLKQMLDL